MTAGEVARAFAPGHVSGLFAVHDEAADARAKGSRGAGWSVAAGATATVAIAPPGADSGIVCNGKAIAAPVTQAALQTLAPGVLFAVELSLDLPVGQGFGMSAAGTLAACLAASRLAGVDPEEALAATHAAEVGCGTGLGDAIGSWHGGAELRTRPGIPPAGWASRIEPPANTQLLYAELGAGIPTPRIIRDAAWKQRTRELADAAVDRILAAGRASAWSAILDESMRFSAELGLLSPGMREAGLALPPGIRWGQCMLGSTLWCEDVPGAAAALARFASVRTLSVDGHGARFVR